MISEHTADPASTNVDKNSNSPPPTNPNLNPNTHDPSQPNNLYFISSSDSSGALFVTQML